MTVVNPAPRVRRPRRPRELTATDVVTGAACFVSSLSFFWVLFYRLTGGIGWFGFGLAVFGGFLALLYVVTADRFGPTVAVDRVVVTLVTACAAALFIALVSIVSYVLVKGLAGLTPHFFVRDQRSITPTLPATAGGASHAIVGTLEQVGLALIWSLPLGVLAAVFLNESRSKWRRPVRIFVDAMSGLPSIMAGLFIYAVLILPNAGHNVLFNFNGFMASLALSLTMLPTITRTVEVVLRLVPDGLREASLAMGASRSRTVWSVVLPTARTGITTGVVLGIARVVGETAPLLLTAFGYNLMNADPFAHPQESLPLFVYRNIRSQQPALIARGAAGALVLLVLVLVLFVVARVIGREPNGSFEAAPQAGADAATDSDGDREQLDMTDLDMTHFDADPTAGDTTEVPATPSRVQLIGGPPPGAATLEARDACAWFGDHLVLEGVDLVMAAGAVTALIGPSGCGKSTFLRLLNRMHELVPGAALDGEVLLDGDDIYLSGVRAQQIRMRVGMVFQKPNPFPAMTIRDNVLSGLKLTRIKCPDRDALVEESLQRAGLWREVRDRLDEPGGGLSGGQQQRLCIARSLAVQPNVLLMDEPCSALDPTSTRRVEETIDELRGLVTIVIVTHNMQQAHRVSDTCAFFLAAENEPGRVIESGPTDVMFSAPRDPRTLDYVNGRFG